jgi:hypothetical protein
MYLPHYSMMKQAQVVAAMGRLNIRVQGQGAGYIDFQMRSLDLTLWHCGQLEIRKGDRAALATSTRIAALARVLPSYQ